MDAAPLPSIESETHALHHYSCVTFGSDVVLKLLSALCPLTIGSYFLSEKSVHVCQLLVSC